MVLLALAEGPVSAAQPAVPTQSDLSKTTKANARGFRVNLALSERAIKLLVEKKETIVVAAYFYGRPKPGVPFPSPEESGEPKGTIGLGDHTVELVPGENAHFGDFQMKRSVLAKVDGRGPQLLINVFSGRKSSKNNLLSCDVYEGLLRSVEGRSIPISCKLITEE